MGCLIFSSMYTAGTSSLYIIVFFLINLISDNTIKFILFEILNISVISILVRIIFTDIKKKS